MPIAYIDGTTGGMVVQLLLGGFVGGFVVFKLAAQSAMDKILRRKPVIDSQDEETKETSENAA